MAYTLDLSLALGPGKTGLTDLRAQLTDTTGANVGSAISTGFVEIGTSGNYLWHYAAFPDAHRGGVKFYSNAAPTVFLLFGAINPEEAEYTDNKISAVAAAVWASGTRTLTSFGTLLADIWTNVTRTLTQPAAQVVASVSGSDLTIIKAVTFEATLTGLNVPAGWDKIYFSVKYKTSQTDADALVQIVVSNPAAPLTDGLLRINGAAGTLAQASLVVNQGAGTVAILLTDDATLLLTTTGAKLYDIKAIVDSVSVILAAGNVTISRTPTLAIE